MSLRRQGTLLTKYSLPPSRKIRRVTVTSLYATSTPAALRCSSSTPPMVRDTSAIPKGLRPSVPLKMTSAISPPRRALADCSPSTQRIASETLDLPHPLGPTMAATPGWKLSDVLSANDLKPNIVRFFKYMTVPTHSVLFRCVKPKPPLIVGSCSHWPQPTRGTESASRGLRRDHSKNRSKKIWRKWGGIRRRSDSLR